MERSWPSGPIPLAIRTAGLVLGFAGMLVVGGAALNRWAPQPADLDAIKPAIFLERALADDTLRERGPDLTWLFFLGDSTTMQRPGRHNLAGSTMRELRRSEPEHRFRSTIVASPGLDVFGYYALGDRIGEESPDVVVLALNLTTFGRAGRSLPRPELAGWIHARHWGETLQLPLNLMNLTADKLLTYRAVVRLGLAETWFRVRYGQRHLGRAWSAIEGWGDAAASNTLHRLRRTSTAGHLRRYTVNGEGKRPNYLRVDQLYGPVIDGLSPDSRWVDLWRRTIEHYASGAGRVVVYAVPINVEFMADNRIPLGTGFDASLALLARVVERAGGEWVDLHALLPDSVFRDTMHFNEGDGAHRTSAVGVALAEHILGNAREVP